MLSKFFEKLRLMIQDKVLRQRVIFTLAILVVFRALAAIPIPSIDHEKLAAFFSNNQFLGLLDIFSGGGFSNLSIVMLGVGPYITASIIMQLLTMMSPKLKALYHEEGEAGRKKISQWSRYLAVPLCIANGLGFLLLLQKQGAIPDVGTFGFLVNVITVSAGSILLMWLGEMVTEFGIGNGVSLIIFAGIVSRIPATASQLAFTFDPAQIPTYLAFLIAALVVTFGVVVVTEAERPVPITYAKRVRGMKVYGGISTYLPLRVNQAGVIPIIFALSILLLPQMVLNFLSAVNNTTIKAISDFSLGILSNQWFYAGAYFILVFLFTYFYTAVTFDPDSISTNLQKSGAFIPGVRPGKPTSEHLANVLTRITLVGALFLGVIAVLPLIMKVFTGANNLAVGGTALLIVVSVVIDLVKKIEAQVSMREY